MLLAVRVLRRIEEQIGVLQVLRDLLRRGEDLAEGGEKLFLICGQRVRLVAEQLHEKIAVILELRVVREAFQRLLRERENFRLREGCGRDGLHVFAVDLRVHGLCVSGARVLTPAEGGVAEEVGEQKTEVCVRLEIREHVVRVRELPLECADSCDLLIDAAERLPPGIVILIERCQVPHIGLVHILSFL